MGFNMLIALCATSLSNMCSCICVSIELSTVVLACCMEITRLYGAFFMSPVMLDQSPQWKLFDDLSYMKYGYVGLCLNEYSGLKLRCTLQQMVKNPSTGAMYCKVTTGERIERLYGYDRYTIQYCK